jgi:GAF domain-containing protein
MSDFILARVSQTLANEHSLETLVRQLLEMLELVTRMESTYLTRIDFDAQRQHIMYAHNSSEMQIPKGSPSRGTTRCANARWTTAAFLATMLPSAGVRASPPRIWGSPPFSAFPCA